MILKPKKYCMRNLPFEVCNHTPQDSALFYIFKDIYYAPQSRPEGPRRCPDRGNAVGALVFLGKFCTVHLFPTVNYQGRAKRGLFTN